MGFVGSVYIDTSVLVSEICVFRVHPSWSVQRCKTHEEVCLKLRELQGGSRCLGDT
jgi:hypothetical protein